MLRYMVALVKSGFGLAGLFLDCRMDVGGGEGEGTVLMIPSRALKGPISGS